MKIQVRPVLGLEVAASLAIMQASAHNTIDIPILITDVALAHCIYGRDRLLDQLEINSNDENDLVSFFTTSTTIALIVSLFGLITIQHGECAPIVSLLAISYKDIKPLLNQYKSLIIGVLWSYAITILPTSINDISLPLFTFYSLLYASASNIADHKDEEEDSYNNVSTLIVQYGPRTSFSFSSMLGCSAIAIHSMVSVWTWGDYLTESVAIGIVLFCGIKSISRKPYSNLIQNKNNSDY